jgi:hypothetical protein
MLEIVFMYQWVWKPLHAITRFWWCKNLYRASRGQHRCVEWTKP